MSKGGLLAIIIVSIIVFLIFKYPDTMLWIMFGLFFLSLTIAGIIAVYFTGIVIEDAIRETKQSQKDK